MPERWYCLEVWRATPEVLDMTHQERLKYVNEQLTFSSQGPFPAGTFDKKAPITLAESAAVLAFFGFVMGCPVSLGLAWGYTLLLGTWRGTFGLAALTASLALHPLPHPVRMARARFTLLLYKYFSYRVMWVDDAFDRLSTCKDEAKRAWVGAGAPHGVLPLANMLSMPALNTFTTHRFVGGAASVVQYTPGLRYMSWFGGAVDVSAGSLERATGKGICVGIVPDGIAGIFQQNSRGGTGAEERVLLQKRKGLAKLSLRTGIPIVPAYSLGNTAVYQMWSDSFGLMEWLSRKLKVSLFIFWGRFGLPLPFRANITMLLGHPVMPSKVVAKPAAEDIDSMHKTILDNISSAFNLHKGACGWGHRTIKFV